MQVIAHPDDDVLFINNDLRTHLIGGYPIVTVVMTAAGLNERDSAAYPHAGSRQAGLRKAYATMAGVASTWTHATLSVGGRVVQVDTLSGAPQIRLVFMNLPEAADGLQPNALGNLFELDTPASTAVPSYAGKTICAASNQGSCLQPLASPGASCAWFCYDNTPADPGAVQLTTS